MPIEMIILLYTVTFSYNKSNNNIVIRKIKYVYPKYNPIIQAITWNIVTTL